MNIIVIGATGMLGKPVTNALIKAGFSVTIMARNIHVARYDFPKAKVIQGDLEDKESITNALKNQDAIYLNLSVAHSEEQEGFHTEEAGINNVIKIAKQLNIKRIAYLSSLIMNYQGVNNFDWWAFKIKKNAVLKIKKSGIPYTIFYPSTFMESIAFQARQGFFILLAGESKYPMYYIAAADFAKQVVKSFQLLDKENREYIIQGTHAYTQPEAAKIFVKNHTKDLLFTAKIPLGVLKFMSKISQEMNYKYQLIEALNNYPEKFDATKTWEELGKPTTSLQEFAKNIEID